MIKPIVKSAMQIKCYYLIIVVYKVYCSAALIIATIRALIAGQVESKATVCSQKAYIIVKTKKLNKSKLKIKKMPLLLGESD